MAPASIKPVVSGLTFASIRVPLNRSFVEGSSRLGSLGVGTSKMVGVPLRPHDLRRQAATYAYCSGIPIEIVSKMILRHSNLSTVQRYLGRITDTKAMKWIENLYG